MDFGRPAQWAGWPYLLHDAQVQAKHLIWGPHAQTGHNAVSYTHLDVYKRQERHGVICRQTTENGDAFISGFADGGIKAYGRKFSKH